MRRKLFLFGMLLTFFVTVASAQWQKRLGIHTAAVNDFCKVDSTFFAATESGLYRLTTTPNGTFWELLDNDFLFTEVKCVYQFKNFLFVGTLQHGLYRSSDKGQSWTHLPDPVQDWTVFCISNIGDTLLAGTNRPNNIYRSTDNGQSWQTSGFLFDHDIHRLVVVGSTIFGVAINSPGLLYRSTDYGHSWLLTNNGLSGTLLSLGVVKKNIVGAPYHLLVGTDIYAYRSTDNGQNWSKVNQIFGVDAGISSFGEHSSGIYACFTNSGIWRSTDGGYTWKVFDVLDRGGPLMKSTMYVDSQLIMIGSDIGCFKYDTQLTRFVYEGLVMLRGTTTPIVNMGSVLFTGSHIGAHVSTNNGGRWETPGKNFVDHVQSIISKDKKLFAAGRRYSSYFYTSSDSGVEWTHPNTLPESAEKLAAAGGYIFCTTVHGIYRTSNEGSSWEKKNNGLPRTDASFDTSYRKVRGIGTDSSLLLISMDSGGVYRSTDAGESWQPSSTGLVKFGNGKYPFFSYFTFNGQDVYVYYSELFNAQIGLYKSSDRGMNWSRISDGKPASIASTYSVATKGRDTVFVGTDSGVWVSYNKGNSWQGLNDGFLGAPRGIYPKVNAVYYLNDYLQASTSIGMWRRKISSTIGVDENKIKMSAGVSLMTYPNPFTGTTTLSYTLSASEHIQLTVHDYLGRMIEKLVNERQEEGVHEVQFDGKHLSAGVYWYRLQAGSKVENKMMVLVK